ncbi:MAG: diguanylate cyclase [Eubacterium sp.]|jgi:PleD family two-component response regulator|nr:diguanylate cyclase [Eubacterium sp.]
MKKNILVISDSVNTNSIFEAILSAEYNVETADSTGEAFEIIKKNTPNLVVSTINYRKSSCFDFIADLRKREEPLKSIPFIIIVAGAVSSDMISKSHKYEVSDFIKLPVEPLDFCRKIEFVLLKYARSYEKLDPVTGLHKKRFAEERIIEMIEDGKKGALLLVDIDRYSFASARVSDEIIKACADALIEIVERDVTVSVTCGGFIIFAPSLKTKAEVEEFAGGIIDLLLKKSEDKIFISIGLAVAERHGSNYADLYQTSDLGLGLARQSGKNRACFYKW